MTDLWKKTLLDYFAAGAVHKNTKKLGVEVEHFILTADGNALPYEGKNGVRQMIGALMKCYPQATVIDDDDFFGFGVPDFNITLEPAAQTEISIAPIEQIAKIGEVYTNFYNNFSPILNENGCTLCLSGCQPNSKSEQLSLIPKKRYILMDEHFRHTGTGGTDMMRATASVQISIDYTSEADFRKKIQAAYFYGPALKLLCDNTPIYRSKAQKTHLKRTQIWRNVDDCRCGVLPHIFSDTYGFADYAEFIGNIPPIFLKHGKEILPTHDKRVKELFCDINMTREDITHVLSMAFPDVRLKQFLEIRFADSVPLQKVLAYCAVVKGLLYSEEGLEYAKSQINALHLSEQDIIAAEDSLIQNGIGGTIYGAPAKQMLKTLLSVAENNLPESETHFLSPFLAFVNER